MILYQLIITYFIIISSLNNSFYNQCIEISIKQDSKPNWGIINGNGNRHGYGDNGWIETCKFPFVSETSELFHHLIHQRKKLLKNVETRIERKIVIDFKLMKFDNLIGCQLNENTIQTQISSVNSYFLEPFLTTKDDKKVDKSVEGEKEKYDARNRTFEKKGDSSPESMRHT